MPPLLRSILAIIAGFITMSLIVVVLTVASVVLLHQKSGHPTPGYLVFNVLYSFFAAIAGGAVAAWIARRKPIQHGAILAAIILVAAGLSYIHYAGTQPLLYQIVMIIAPPICAVLGAAIVARNVSSPL